MTPTTDPPNGLLARLIEASAKSPVLTLALVAALAAWGYISLRRTPLDAIPDLSDVQVIVFSEWQGQSPDLVEDQITYPISSALLAAPRVRSVRGQSFFGLSFVYVIFEDGTDLYWARSRVLEYLDQVKGHLPEGARATLGPDATGVGWVLQYALVDRTGKHDLADLRTLQDWHLRYGLESVPGVAEVASVGGFVRQYQVQLDPNRLLSYGVTVPQVVRAVRESNQDVGGRILEIAGHEQMIRGRGYIHSLQDLEQIPVAVSQKGGVPVLLRDVAEMNLGPEIRRGVAELDGEGEAVGGIVVMRYGENALEVIQRVKDRLAELEATLPEGVEVELTYDRSELIEASIATLRHTLIEEMIVVSLIIFIFLLHVRSALVVVLTLPIGVILAFIPMLFQDLTANIMSLGGIAVAIGAMVDASIVIIENIHKHLQDPGVNDSPQRRQQALIRAMQEVGPSIFFSLLVITVSFLPIFTFQAQQGRLFRPLAFTKTYAMGFAAILAVTLTPALAALLVRGRIRPQEANPFNRALVAVYSPIARWCVRHREWVVVGALAAVVATLPTIFILLSPARQEFMPPLNEGAILYMPTAPPGMSITEASDILHRIDRKLRTFPEVERVFGKLGRARTSTDPAPLSMAEITVLLKPRDQWRDGLTWDGLIEEMDQKLQIPGMPNVWWMPVQTRTEMLSTGVRGKLGVKVFGDTFEDIEAAALEVERVLTDVPGTRSVAAERVTGGFFADFVVKREEAARYGLRVADVNAIVMSGIGGMNISESIEGRERYPINVRYAREFRDEPDRLSEVLVGTPSGAQVPIGQIADLKFRTGPPMIRSEDGKLMAFVTVDVKDRSIPGYVADARAVLRSRATLSDRVRLEWAGQFLYLERARKQLSRVLPLTLFLVIVLLYFNTRSWAETGMVLTAVLLFGPLGAAWALIALGYNVSVAVWVGLIALLGLAAETGVVMMLYLRLSLQRRIEGSGLHSAADLEDAIVDGAAQRVRPIVMTTMTTMIGLMPLLWSTGTGADVMRRLAAPMIGGLISSFVLTLMVFPALFAIWKARLITPESAAGSAPIRRHEAAAPVGTE